MSPENSANLLDPTQDHGTPRLAVRFGRSLRLNGTDETAHILDANISPSGALDLDASNSVTFACYVSMLAGGQDVGQVLMAKRADANEASSNPGWVLYVTEDGYVRCFVDDGAGNTAAVTTANATGTKEIGYGDLIHYFILVVWDRDSDELALWWSPSRNPWEVRQVDTADISSVGDTSNTDPFALGAVTSDGSTFANEAAVELGWAAVWDEVLDSDSIDALTRFQLPVGDGPDDMDRRLVSCWHWSNFDATDWNRTNANDLTTSNVGRDNYIPGPERYGVLNQMSVTPSMGSQPGKARVQFYRFRPEILSEGFYRIVGDGSAPPLRWVRTSKEAADTPGWSSISSRGGVNGRYAVALVAITSTTAEFWIWDARLDEENDSVYGWQRLGKIGTASSTLDPESNVVFEGDGACDFCYFVNAGGDLVVVDISDPTSPSVHTTLSPGTGAYGSQMLRDERDNGRLLIWNRGAGRLHIIDITSPGAPTNESTLAPGIGDWTFPSAGPPGQDGDLLWICAERGVGAIDISTTASPSVHTTDGIVQTDPDGVDDDAMLSLVVMDNGQLVTLDADGAIWHWDTLVSTTDPVPTKVRADDANLSDSFRGHLLPNAGVAVFWLNTGGDHSVAAINLVEPNQPRHIATYDISDYTGFGVGAQADGYFFGHRMAYLGNGADDSVNLFKFDPGEGFSGLELEYPVGLSVATNPRPRYEHRDLISDFQEDDFEDVSVGSTPTGWSRTAGTASSTHAASDERALTGAPPGQKGQSLKLELGGGDSEVELSKGFTVDAADAHVGTPILVSFYHLVSGAALDVDTDFEIEIGDGTTTKTYALSNADAQERWLPNDLVFELTAASATVTVRLKLTNSSTATVYIDSVRVGVGRLPLAFSGRVTAATGAGDSEDVEGVAEFYSVEMVDRMFDLNRTPVTATVESAAAATTIASLISTYTRGDDRFNADNVDSNLGSHDPIKVDDGAEPKTMMAVLSAIAEQLGAVFYLDYAGSVHMRQLGFMPSPVAVNDVHYGWWGLEDTKDGADMVTEATVLGDRSGADPVSATVTKQVTEDRWGAIAHTFSSRGNVTTQSTATALAEFFRDLHGTYHFQGRVSMRADSRLRPGVLLPVQVEGRAMDRVVLVSQVTLKATHAKVVATVNYAVLQESFAAMVLRDRDEEHQRGKKQVTQEYEDRIFWDER